MKRLLKNLFFKSLTYLLKDRNNIHPAAFMYASEVKNKKLSQREYMAVVTSLGLSVKNAYKLIDLNNKSVKKKLR